MTDDSLNTGLIGGIEERPIVIVAYNQPWPDIFETHASVISTALGNAALRIEHIGSTSVPGLGAKPIVDILLVVEDSAAESSYRATLEQAGYQLRVREPEFHEHRMFRIPKKDEHIHVFSLSCPEIGRYLAFRNRLRDNEPDRQRYEQMKRELAERSWPDMNAYAEAKTQCIEQIIAAAQAAGDHTGLLRQASCSKHRVDLNWHFL